MLMYAKVRAIEDKKFMRLDPVGGPWGFFGWPSVRADSEAVVLTEGELDALSVYQVLAAFVHLY
jgi:hypothetical protein